MKGIGLLIMKGIYFFDYGRNRVTDYGKIG